MPNVILGFRWMPYAEEIPGGHGLRQLHVKFEDSPLAEAVRNALDVGDHEALQVRWSGEGFYIHLTEFERPEDAQVNCDTHELDVGQVVFHPQLKELIFAYGPMFLRHKGDILDCHVIGQVTGVSLPDIGFDIHRRGRHMVTLYPPKRSPS